MIRQGEVYYADFVRSGRRPVLVVSRDALNRGQQVVVVSITTSRLDERRRLSNCVYFRAGEFGLTQHCVAQCETIIGVPVDRLDPHPVGRLDDITLRSVINAIGRVIDADCEPI